MNEEQIKNIVEANKIVLEDIISNESFSIQELCAISDRMKDLIDNLQFWYKQDNSERFFYELKIHMNWLLENFS